MFVLSQLVLTLRPLYYLFLLLGMLFTLISTREFIQASASRLSLGEAFSGHPQNPPMHSVSRDPTLILCLHFLPPDSVPVSFFLHCLSSLTGT